MAENYSQIFKSGFLEVVKECPNCLNPDTQPISKLPPTHIFKCPQCLLYFISPRLNDKAIHSLYTENPGLINKEQSGNLKSYMFNRYSQMIDEMPKPINSMAESILDIGCGWGHFLHHCRPHFTSLTGCDFSQIQTDWARSKFNLESVYWRHHHY